MRPKPRIIVVTLFLISFLAYGPFSKGEDMSNSLDLVLEIDKTIYSVGDEIELTYTFLNKSNAGIYLLPWGGHYTTNWIIVFSGNGRRLQDIPLAYCEIKLMPTREDFLFLKPMERHTIAIKGKIIKSTLSKFNRNNQKKYSGIFIDFSNSAVFLDKPGNFAIKAVYKGLTEWKDKGEKLYNLKNIWTGDLQSDEVKIVVK